MVEPRSIREIVTTQVDMDGFRSLVRKRKASTAKPAEPRAREALGFYRRNPQLDAAGCARSFGCPLPEFLRLVAEAIAAERRGRMGWTTPKTAPLPSGPGKEDVG